MPHIQSPATIVKHLQAVLARALGWDCTSVPEDNALGQAIGIVQRSAKSNELLACIARMTTEEEMEGGMTYEDAVSTLNDLLASARQVTGIEPGHPKVHTQEEN